LHAKGDFSDIFAVCKSVGSSDLVPSFAAPESWGRMWTGTGQAEAAIKLEKSMIVSGVKHTGLAAD